jgi:TolB-like protein
MVLLLAGCGQTVVETLQVSQAAGSNAPGKGKTIVILPFADYTNADTLAAAHRRDMAITESLTDRLVTNGFKLPIQEDVFAYMVDQSIISLVAYEQKNSVSLNNELSAEWSDVMKDQIRGYISEQQTQRDNQLAASPGTHGLTEQTVAKIGRKFHADYIVRGRILEFKTRQEHTWAPWKRGVLPFISGTTSQISFGFASTDQYDNINNMIAGGTWGGIIGHNVGGPWDPTDGGSEILGVSGGSSNANTILWGAVGALAGREAKNSGRVDQAVVQMRIWIQEAATGNVIWTNRVDVKVSPESVLADKQYDALFNQAIEKGVTTLIDNFITTAL